MSILSPAAERRSFLRAARSTQFSAEIGTELDQFIACCAALHDDRSLPFHSPAWLRAWYTTFGRSPGSKPLWLIVRLRASGQVAALLPLVSRRRGGLRVVEFADAGVVDYNAPILAPDWHGQLPEKQAAQALWAAVREALAGHDLFFAHKLLPSALLEAGDRPNPLALVLEQRPCEMFGNVFDVAPESEWETWRRSLEKRTRKEIERCWRVFQRSPVARFEHQQDPQQALALFEVLEQQQSQRMKALQTPYKLDAPECKAFYRQLILDSLSCPNPGSQVVMTALIDGDEVVSALFGLVNGHRYMGLRQSIGGEAWKACSPARLLDEQTARHFHGQGRQHFDFGIGDYHHKHALNMRTIALVDACEALSPRGLPALWGWRLRRRLKSHPRVVALWRRMGGLRHSQRPAAAAADAAACEDPQRKNASSGADSI